MSGSRHSDNAFRLVSIGMVILGIGVGMLRLLPQVTPDESVRRTVDSWAPLLLSGWLLTMVLWLLLLVARVRDTRRRRREDARQRRVRPRRTSPSTMQTQWKQQDPTTAWAHTNLDTHERAFGSERHEPSGWWGDSGMQSNSLQALSRFGGDSILDLNRPVCWTLELLQELEWHRFEQVAAGFFRLNGFDARPLARGPDAEISLELRQPDTVPVHAFVIARAGTPTIDIDQVRVAYALMTREGLGQSFFLTSGRFTSAAVEAARGIGIFLMDGESLLKRLVALPTAPQETLLQLAIRGDYRTPTCPACGNPMGLRSGDFKSFWRCTSYPECKTRLPSNGTPPRPV